MYKSIPIVDNIVLSKQIKASIKGNIFNNFNSIKYKTYQDFFFPPQPNLLFGFKVTPAFEGTKGFGFDTETFLFIVLAIILIYLKKLLF